MMNLASLENVRNSGNFEVLDRCYLTLPSCHVMIRFIARKQHYPQKNKNANSFGTSSEISNKYGVNLEGI